MKLLNFNMFEKVQPEWFEKNPNFYLSRAGEELKGRKQQIVNADIQEKKYINLLKKTSIDSIKFQLENINYHITEPSFLFYFQITQSNKGLFFITPEFKTEYNYKVLLSLIYFLNKDDVLFYNIDKNIINPLFLQLKDYYGLYYNIPTAGVYLYLTKNLEDYKKKISEIRQDKDNRILYYNNKTKGKQYTDIDLIEINKIVNQIKNIKIDDISFEKHQAYMYHPSGYSVKFKDEKLNDGIEKYKLIPPMFFQKESHSSKHYFGHLRNRYHTSHLTPQLMGIGFGYKLYKSFLKFNGYMISDEQTTLDARKIYLHFLKDEDIYSIIDKDSNHEMNKVMVICKDYPKLEQLIKIVRIHELRNKKHYVYDKNLLKYIKGVKK